MRTVILVAICGLCLGCPVGGADGPSGTRYEGAFSGQLVDTTTSNGHMGGGEIVCYNTFSVAGTLTIDASVSGDDVTGLARVRGTETETGKSGDPTCPLVGNRAFDVGPEIASKASNLQFDGNASSASNAAFATTNRATFVGTLSGTVASGVLKWARHGAGTVGQSATSGGTSVQSDGSVSMSVTLTAR